MDKFKKITKNVYFNLTFVIILCDNTYHIESLIAGNSIMLTFYDTNIIMKLT